jgi:hypothetical protein
MSIRICRHCRKDVSLSAIKCPHCKGKLHPAAFKAVLIGMVVSLLVAYGAVGYGYMSLRQAQEQLFCDISASIDGGEETCAVLCRDFCTGRGADSGFGLERVSAQCECTCSGCFDQPIKYERYP